MKCEHCGTVFPDDIGGSYDIQRCRADCLIAKIARLSVLVEKIRLEGPDAFGARLTEQVVSVGEKRLALLHRQLEAARYVGD